MLFVPDNKKPPNSATARKLNLRKSVAEFRWNHSLKPLRKRARYFSRDYGREKANFFSAFLSLFFSIKSACGKPARGFRKTNEQSYSRYSTGHFFCGLSCLRGLEYTYARVKLHM